MWITFLSGGTLLKIQEVKKIASLRDFLKLTGLTSCLPKVIETAISARKRRPSDICKYLQVIYAALEVQLL